MEHEINQLIRRKVRQVEEQPVHWQRERVWDMIATKPQPKSRRSIFYYAAASIVVVISVILYVVKFSNQKESEPKNTPLESTRKKPVEQNPVNPKTVAVSVYTPSPMETPHPEIVSGKETIRRPSPTANTLDISSPEVIPDKTEVTVSAVSGDETKQLMPESADVTIEQPPVRAIIGFIPQQQQVAQAKKVRKSKVRFFRSSRNEADALPTEETRLLTARIN